MSQNKEHLTWQIGCLSLIVWLASNINLLDTSHKDITVWHLHLSCTEIKTENNDGSVTWEDKDKAGCQSSNQWDHSTNIWDEEGEDEGHSAPHQSLQDHPPLFTTYTHLNLLASETQPKSFYNRPGETNDTRVQ